MHCAPPGIFPSFVVRNKGQVAETVGLLRWYSPQFYRPRKQVCVSPLE